MIKVYWKQKKASKLNLMISEKWKDVIEEYIKEHDIYTNPYDGRCMHAEPLMDNFYHPERWNKLNWNWYIVDHFRRPKPYKLWPPIATGIFHEASYSFSNGYS